MIEKANSGRPSTFKGGAWLGDKKGQAWKAFNF
jgi:hypothetical protein